MYKERRELTHRPLVPNALVEEMRYKVYDYGGFKDEPEPERKSFRKRRGFKITYFFLPGKNCI